MKVMDYLLVALLAYTAYLQINDPDPLYWVLVYLLGAAVPLLNALGKPNLLLGAMVTGMTVSGLLWTAPGVSEWLLSGDFGSITGSMDGPARYVEPAREFIGLFMQLLVISYYLLRWRRTQN